MLQKHGLVVSDTVLVAVVLELNQNEGLARCGPLGGLGHSGLVERRRIGIYGVDDVPPGEPIDSSQHHHLRLGQVVDLG